MVDTGLLHEARTLLVVLDKLGVDASKYKEATPHEMLNVLLVHVVKLQEKARLEGVSKMGDDRQELRKRAEEAETACAAMREAFEPFVQAEWPNDDQLLKMKAVLENPFGRNFISSDKAEKLTTEVEEARSETRPVAEWCHAVLAAIRVVENAAIHKANRFRNMETQAEAVLAHLDGIAEGAVSCYDAVHDLPGWTGSEGSEDMPPESMFHAIIERHEKASEEAQQKLQMISERLRRAGATLPAPKVSGALESSMVEGLSLALAMVEEETA